MPSLSAIRPRPDQPEWDTAIWLDILSLPGTPQANAFYHEFEAWLFDHFSGDYASLRVEWSKGWGYSPPPPGTSRRWSTSWWRSRYARAWSQTTIGTARCAS